MFIMTRECNTERQSACKHQKVKRSPGRDTSHDFHKDAYSHAVYRADAARDLGTCTCRHACMHTYAHGALREGPRRLLCRFGKEKEEREKDQNKTRQREFLRGLKRNTRRRGKTSLKKNLCVYRRRTGWRRLSQKNEENTGSTTRGQREEGNFLSLNHSAESHVERCASKSHSAYTE